MSDYRDFKIGQKVWRAKWDKIEEGVVVGTKKVSFTNTGSMYDNPKGEYVAFIATFDKPHPTNGFHYDLEEQTYAWKFFPNEVDAYRVLAREAYDRKLEALEKAKQWDEIYVKASDFVRRNK
jgi:hypothetical protein